MSCGDWKEQSLPILSGRFPLDNPAGVTLWWWLSWEDGYRNYRRDVILPRAANMRDMCTSMGEVVSVGIRNVPVKRGGVVWDG